MLKNSIYCAGSSPAIRYAEQALRSRGYACIDVPEWNTGHVLLDVPSFRDGKILRMGGNIDTLLGSLPKNVTIWGGNLSHPSLENYKTVDLLKDEQYLTQNAAITADCALQITSPLLSATWQDSPALVIGWGRIGKCLSKLLKNIGNDVTVASRNPSTRYALQSMGYRTADLQSIHNAASQYRVVFNTAPDTVIGESEAADWKNCIKIDLASCKGIAGENVIWAKGLPGIHAPESSGKLIADTLCRLWKEMEL